MLNYNDNELLWFRSYEPEESTIEKICKYFECKRVEFYILSLNVCKVEKGLLIKIDKPNDIYELSEMLKNSVIISSKKYNIEDKIMYNVITNKKIMFI